MMEQILLFTGFFIWFAYWSAESGASLPWSSKWQSFTSWGNQLPEWIIAASVAGLATWGWNDVFSLGWWNIAVFVVSFFIALAGKESATWAYLNWQSHTPRSPNRQSTLRPINDFIAGLFGFELGDEGYAWVWAATKGFIMTLPIIPTGTVFHPVGHEIGSHAEGRLPGDPNMYKELSGGGFGYAPPAFLFVTILIPTIKMWIG